MNPAPHGPLPSSRQLAWHRRECYGFVHFTQNTFTDLEWGFGDEDPAAFKPTALDCRQWVRAAKAGGLQALILTAKHHDGFCLWPTDTTPHNIRRSTYKNGGGDIVAELAEACREGGLGLGLYCSPWDRNHADYGQPGYVDVYHAQWRELLTRYGPLVELWFDGANGGEGYYGGAREKREIAPATYYRYTELWAECRRLQPDAVIFSDIGPDIRWCGNERGFGGTTTWCPIRQDGMAVGHVPERERLSRGDPDGTVWCPPEYNVSIRPGWFYHPGERPRSAEHLFAIWLASVGRNGNLHLNLTPDRRGLIPETDLLELARLRGLVAGFTAVDLAAGLTPEVSASASGEPGALVDGRADTWWASAKTSASVAFHFGTEHRIGGIRIEEAVQFGQRVTGFVVEVRCEGTWFEVAVGTTIGARRILRFEQTVADQLRLRITGALAAPVLSAVQVYAG